MSALKVWRQPADVLSFLSLGCQKSAASTFRFAGYSDRVPSRQTATFVTESVEDDSETPSNPNRLVDVVAVVGATLVIAYALRPADWFTNATMWRGDNAGHAVVPWVLAHDMLPHFSLGGWSDAMYAGIPVNGLYPPFGATMIAVLSFAIPLLVAYKIILVAPLLLLPLVAWSSGRLGAVPRPYPAMAAVMVLPFAFAGDCLECGGTVVSNSLGEYAYSWGVLLSVLAAGLVFRLAGTGEGQVVAALAVALALLSHPATSIWLVVFLIVVVVVQTPWRDRDILRRLGSSLAVAALLSLAWWLPFMAGRPWMPDNGAPSLTDVLPALFPASLALNVIVGALAIVGAFYAFRAQYRWLIAVTIVTIVTGALIAFLPHTLQLDNQRLVPLWAIGKWMLVAAGLSAIARELRDRVSGPVPQIVSRWSPVIAGACVAIVIAATWGWVGAVRLPVTDGGDGQGSLLGLSYSIDEATSFPTATFAGYPARSTYSDFLDMQGALKSAAAKGECGRLAWDVGFNDTKQGGPFGDELIQWQSEVWTDGCLRAMSGILQDSSSTAPAIWAASSVSSNGSVPILPYVKYAPFDWPQARVRLASLGVPYYLTHGGAVEAAVKADPAVSRIASQGRWTLWRIPDVSVATALTNYPVVVDRDLGSTRWYELDQVYRASPNYLSVPLAESGPDNWPRTKLDSAPPVVPVPSPATVTNVSQTGDSISFTVDHPGSPVLIRVSDFPGWSVEGASGPYRVTPNFLAVVPTANTVTLTRARTTTDWAAFACGLAGVAGLVALVVMSWRDRRRNRGEIGDVTTN